MEKDVKEFEENNSNNKPDFSTVELLKCLALVVLGCVAYVVMPDEMGILGWILFSIGTVLNIIGIFRLVGVVPEVKEESTRKIVTIATWAAAVIVQVIGLAYLYNSNGTVKSIAITTLTLCVSLGLIIYLVDFDDKEMMKKMAAACRIVTVILIAIAVFLLVRDDFSKVSIYVGTILIIEALITGKVGLTKQLFF